MPYWKHCFVVAVAVAAVPAYSQSSPAAAPPPATSAPTTAAEPAAVPPADSSPPGPSAETLRRAKSVGLRPEKRKNGTVYCWEDATTGTRFTTKKCVDEDQLSDMIAQREAQQDKMKRSVGSQ